MQNTNKTGKVKSLCEVRSAFTRANKVIDLANVLAFHGYQVQSPKHEGYFRYSLYAPQGWIEDTTWVDYLEETICYEELENKRNDGYLGDFIVNDDCIDWLLQDPCDTEARFPNPCHCEALLLLAEVLGVKLRDLVYSDISKLTIAKTH